jgi:hypothetical protein
MVISGTVIWSVTTGTGSGSVTTGIVGIVTTGPGDGSVTTGPGSVLGEDKKTVHE